MSSANKTQWIEGIRGIAAFQVMTHHIVWAIAPWLLHPSTNGKVSVLQWPLFNQLYGGASVPEFLMIGAFVSAIRPIKLSRAGQTDESLANLAKATFRRTFRLTIPVFALTFFAWILCQLGAFRFAKTFEASNWVVDTSPAPSTGFFASFKDLFVNFFHTWTTTQNIYEKNFWLMKMFLEASFHGYLIMLAAAFVDSSRRLYLYGFLYAYAYVTQNHHIGLNVAGGIALAEICQMPTFQRFIETRTRLASTIAVLLFSVGITFAAYPLFDADSAQWSNQFVKLGNVILPANADQWRYFTSMAAQLMIGALSMSPYCQSILSNPWLVWMGQVSFPVYLIHGTCIRTVMMYVLYGLVNDRRKESDPITQKEVISIALFMPFFYALVYGLAHLWSVHVDPLCTRLARWMEEKIFLHDVQREKSSSYMPLPTTA